MLLVLVAVFDIVILDAKDPEMGMFEEGKKYGEATGRFILSFGSLGPEFRRAILNGFEHIGGIRKHGRALIGPMTKVL